QARNVMLVDHHPYFIDYQGGRRGPLQYDLASLLFQVRAEIPFDIREELLNYYIEKAGEVATLQSARFKKYYYGFVWLRLMQVMGAYGFRGLFQKKEHFIASIPYAVKNIEWLERHAKLEIELPEIRAVFDRIKKQFGINKETSGQETSSLSVRINSFAYKNGIPADQTDNGGGFVFDCRGLPNPGRLAQYKELTGKDQQVIAYLEEQEEVHQFLGYVKAILKQSVEKYMDRDFTSLMVNFGCTGGQHRSVFCAEKAGRYLQQNFPVSVDLYHREIL
ncbi:MAG: RNase adapter RapZ, partial [Bacteroidota bacterium]|nr:RNase adapter RapZ [Bacteroidota bacterium]